MLKNISKIKSEPGPGVSTQSRQSAQVKHFGENNRLRLEDRAAHDWYRFVLSFPPHLVRQCIDFFQLEEGDIILDPFCGTGTTLVECKKRGIKSIGLEANPMASFASRVKLEWNLDEAELLKHAQAVAAAANARLKAQGLEDDQGLPLFRRTGEAPGNLKDLTSEEHKLLLKNSISPLPLHRILELMDSLKKGKDEKYHEHELLALAKTIVFGASNLNFGPEVGVGAIKHDAPVISIWLNNVRAMAEDIERLRMLPETKSQVHAVDARSPNNVLAQGSVSAVITSPPYPNEKDYTRTTRLESVLLGLLSTRDQLRTVKKNLLRSNTRGVYKNDADDKFIADHKGVQRIAELIESRRIEMGKTSGFERLYGRVTRLYFGGMAQHLSNLRPALRPGAKLAYVVGDQASYLRVMIRTGQLLADIAHRLGYEVLGIDLFRTRLSTATREQLREEIVFLRWPGEK